jgi:hypothetical protein
MSITNKRGRLHSDGIEIGSKRFGKVGKFKFLGMVINSKNNDRNHTGQNSSRKQSVLR